MPPTKNVVCPGCTLLCDDIERLGWLGDVVEVNEGYARNYLLPQGLAKVASQGNMKAIAKEKASRGEERIKVRKRLSEVAEKVEGAEAVVAAKANEQGHLFGSITEKEIAANLREQGFAIADETVKLTAHIKEVGTHTVTLKFAEDLKVSVSVVVVSDQPAAEVDAVDSDTA